MEKLESAQEGQLCFLKRNPNYDISYRYLLYLVITFSESVTVNNRNENNPRVINEEPHIEVLEIFATEPTTSLRSVEEQTGMSHEPVKKVSFEKYLLFALFTKV